MADQTVRIENLNDSDERVAFDLYNQLRGYLPFGEGTAAIERDLRLFSICRRVVRSGEVNVSALN